MARVLTLVVSLIVACPVSGWAQAPLNDACDGAFPIACDEIVTGSTTTATPDAVVFCGTSDGSGGGVWYRCTGNGGEFEITTCHPGTDYDTKLRVFSGDCGNLVCVDGNDDTTCSFSGLRSKVNWFTTDGEEYFILVHGFSGSEGNYEMSLVCYPPPVADPNDHCEDAQVITPGIYSGNSAGNDSDGSTSCGNANDSPSLWYYYQPPEDQTIRVSTCGSSYDTVVSLHSGCPGTTANEIICADNGCGGSSTASYLQLDVSSGEDLYIRVSGANGAAGNFTMTLESFLPGDIIGPDVIYSDCQGISNYGAIGGIRAYTLGSHTCNIGDENLQWGGVTPLLAMNAYRLHEGRLEQIGMSFVKNGTGAAAGSGCGLPCNGQGGSVLGAGCRDVYSSGYNGIQSILGPRSTVNAFTGDYPGASGSAPTELSKRLQIHESDLGQTGAGAVYFVEGVFVAPDDAANGNALNNASYKRVTVTGSAFDLTPIGAMEIMTPAIQAWADHGLGVDTPDPSVTLQTVDVPNEGRFHAAQKVSDLGGGQWHYEYAIFNLNSHRSAASLSVPVGPGVTISAAGFHDVDYHSGEPYDLTDWAIDIGTDHVTWSSPATFAVDENTNALRWGTMYNFWFDADIAPTTQSATLALFRPGTPASLSFELASPDGGIPEPTFVRGDCNADDASNIADAIALLALLFPTEPTAVVCDDACDANDDGILDIADPIALLDYLFASGPALDPPSSGCGIDPTDDGLDCSGFPVCP